MQYQVYLKHSGNNYSLSTPLPTGGCPDPSNKGSGIVLLDRDKPTAVAKEETSDLRFRTNESTRLHNSSELGLLPLNLEYYQKNYDLVNVTDELTW